MSDRPSYEVAVVGGGPAGVTTALYTTRLGHRTAVFEKQGGRHATVSHVHNLFGVSEDVSGQELANQAIEQFEEYGGEHYLDPVNSVESVDHADSADSAGGRFVVDANDATVEAERVVLATGFTDVGPSVPGLREFTGRGLHYCLHCDAYSLGDSRVFVLGHGESAAHVAMVLLNFTDDVDLLLDGHDPEWSDETERQLRAHPVDCVEREVVGAFAREERAADQREAAERASGEERPASREGEQSELSERASSEGRSPSDHSSGRSRPKGEASRDDERRESRLSNHPREDGEERPASSATDQREAAEEASGDERPASSATDAWLGGLTFADGAEREYLGGFAMYGKRYNTALAESLGCELADDGALAVDENYETSVDGAYGVGDLTHGQNQTVVALGDGAKAGIAVHKDLRRYPRPPDELDGIEEAAVPAASDALRERMRLVRNRDTHAGLRGPEQDR